MPDLGQSRLAGRLRPYRRGVTHRLGQDDRDHAGDHQQLEILQLEVLSHLIPPWTQAASAACASSRSAISRRSAATSPSVCLPAVWTTTLTPRGPRNRCSAGSRALPFAL